jgi:cysteine desulfurase
MGQSLERRSLEAVIPSASEGFVVALIATTHEQVAELIGAHAMHVIFTSCATESNNAAIASALKANPGKRRVDLQRRASPPY